MLRVGRCNHGCKTDRQPTITTVTHHASRGRYTVQPGANRDDLAASSSVFTNQLAKISMLFFFFFIKIDADNNKKQELLLILNLNFCHLKTHRYGQHADVE